jgi:hypothetical protein
MFPAGSKLYGSKALNIIVTPEFASPLSWLTRIVEHSQGLSEYEQDRSEVDERLGPKSMATLMWSRFLFPFMNEQVVMRGVSSTQQTVFLRSTFVILSGE